MLMKYGPTYLERAEGEEILRQWEAGYQRFLASNMLPAQERYLLELSQDNRWPPGMVSQSHLAVHRRPFRFSRVWRPEIRKADWTEATQRKTLTRRREFA